MESLPNPYPPGLLPFVQSYYEPSHIMAIDQLDVPISDYQVLTDDPPPSGFTASSVTWQGTESLSPTMTAMKVGSADDRANKYFYAGILLASAAAAGIALIQEIRSSEDDPDSDGQEETAPRNKATQQPLGG
jgi:hypothetical protein